MNLREKLIVQTVICLMIFAGVRTVSMSDIEIFNKAEEMVSGRFLKNYTIEDLKSIVSETINKASGIHETVTTSVMQTGNDLLETSPLGEKNEEGIQIVYGLTGGKITEAGINDEYGLYVKVEADGGTFVYGNMTDMAVVTGERIRAGQILGSYDSKSEKEFYYKSIS